MAIKKAQAVDADIVMASDPDADRMGIAIKNDKGEWILVNGNQTDLMFTYYILRRRMELGILNKTDFMVKTIVTSELIKDVCNKYKVEMFDCYTGFKWIAAVIREQEGKRKFIGGGEESYGYMPADFVRDKDAVASCALMAELTAWAKDNGLTLFELLQDIYVEFGFSKEKGISIVKKGKEGADEIQQMMKKFRVNPPKEIAGSPVVVIKDYQFLQQNNLLTGVKWELDFPESSNVLQFFTEDGTKISVRPSGTEPKIKFYIEVRTKMNTRADYESAEAFAQEKIEAVRQSLGI
jgi:phosphoglucomutase